MPFFRRKQDTDAIELRPAELKRLLDQKENVLILDVRQPDALVTYPFTIPGSVRIPPADLPDRHAELPRDRRIVAFCT